MEVIGQPHALATLLPEKSPLCELSSRMGGSHSQSGYLREEKNFLPLPSNQTVNIQPTV